MEDIMQRKLSSFKDFYIGRNLSFYIPERWQCFLTTKLTICKHSRRLFHILHRSNGSRKGWSFCIGKQNTQKLVYNFHILQSFKSRKNRIIAIAIHRVAQYASQIKSYWRTITDFSRSFAFIQLYLNVQSSCVCKQTLN